MMPAIDTRIWYREPMVWLVFGLPAMVVLASLMTLTIAVRSGGADSVADPVQRVGKGQTIDLAPDQMAARRDVHARLTLIDDSEAIELALQGDVADAAYLNLTLQHPTLAANDRDVQLVRVDAQRYLGRLALPRGHAWNVQLAANDGSWRIHGRLARDSRSADLVPAFDRD